MPLLSTELGVEAAPRVSPQNLSRNPLSGGAAASGRGLASIRVLLVDDDEDEWLITRDLLREVERGEVRLSASGHRTQALGPRFHLDWVSNYDEAIAVIARAEHDVYLIDYRLGARSGLDLLREVGASGLSAPLILLTGQGDPEVDVQATRAGAADYLVKEGLDAALLERAIRYAIAQKRTQEQLREAAAQNAQLGAAISNANVGVLITNWLEDDHPIVFANVAFESITGYSADEVIGQNVRILQGHDDDGEQCLRAVRERVAGGLPFDGILLSYRKDGTPFWNAMQISPIRDENGFITSSVCFLSDVTSRIEAENALRQSRENLEAAQRLTHLGSWRLYFDENGRISDRSVWSDEVFRIVGLDPHGSPIPTRSHVALVHPDDLENTVAAYWNALSGRAPFDIECRLVRPDGEERLVHLRAEFERGEDGSPRSIVGTVLDITERKRAETLARQSQSRLHLLVENAPLIIWSLSAQGTIDFVQGRALESLHIRAEELVGQSIFETDLPGVLRADLARRALEGHESSSIAEIGGFVFDTTYSVLHEEGRIGGVVGVSFDITERVRAQRELGESEARFARIVANVPGMVYRLRRTPEGEMHFVSVSDGCLDIAGMTADEMQREFGAFLALFATEDQEALRKSLEISQDTLSPWNWEGQLHRPDGERKWIRGQSRPARLADGSTVWDGLMVDITASRMAQEELLQSRSALDQAQKLARIGSFEWDLQRGELHWSEQMFRLLGFEPNAFRPHFHSLLEFVDPADQNDLRKHSEAALDLGYPHSLMVRIRRRDGELRVLQIQSRVETDESGRVSRWLGSAQDVTETVEAQRALHESEQRYALAAQGANDGLWDWDLQSGAIYLSPRWKMMLGYGLDAIGDDPKEWFSRVHYEDFEHLQTTLSQHLSGLTSHFECEYRLRSADESYRWMLGRGLAVYDTEGKAHRIAGSQTDISAHKTAEAQLSRNAFYDTLTGLPNRALFLDRLDKTLSRAKRHADYSFAVLFLDIDRFKKINDSLGHVPGDQLLMQAGARFESCLRPGDTVARLGGDEFAILIDDIGDEDAIDFVAGRIQKELERPFSLDGRDVFVTVSIGVAPCRGGQDRPDELLRNADTAMYRAKGLGRARHEVFDNAMHQRALKMLELETDLWRAIERDELLLHYQPIIELKNGTVCGYEALLRWQHPVLGLLLPGDFIPLAEESGLIVPIGWWVLEEACRQTKAWQNNPDFKNAFCVSVNLSSKQFSQSDFLERVRDVVGSSGLEAHCLNLEITESVIMENTDSASAMLQTLKTMGFRLSMDDFGTGYSSLSYLHRFPLDTLKIDRSFVSQMRSAQNQIVTTILALAKGLSLDVVAEGVETTEQLHGLRAMGCEFAQGYWFSKPVSAAKLEDFLATKPVW